MSDIYTRCSLVLVWLGNDPEMVRAARHFGDEMENADGISPANNSFLEILLSNPYFNRVWIVQEVSLAKNIWIFCGDVTYRWAAVKMGVDSLNQLNMTTAVYPITVKDLFKAKDVKNRRLDQVAAVFSRHECQDVRDKVYGFLGLVADTQRVEVDYAKTPHQVFLDVLPIVLRTYWENKSSEVIYNHMFHGHFQVYLENLLKLAWNMKFSEHDQRALMEMFKEIVFLEQELSEGNPYGLSLMDIFDGFGYGPVNTDMVGKNSPGTLTGKWWIEVCGLKTFFECRTLSQPLQRYGHYPAWEFLHNVQKNETWPGKEAMEASQQRLQDSKDPYPWDSEEEDDDDRYYE